MNSFYQQSKTFQWLITIVMTLVASCLTVYAFELMKENLWAILLLFLFTPMLQFLSTPLMTLTGVYKYLSPMLLVYSPNDKKYDLHNGTSFDYLFLAFSKDKKISWQNCLLQYYIDGLLKIVEAIELGELPDTVEIRGSSYFFSKRTAHKLGFQTGSTGTAEKINIVLNYIDLIWKYSLSQSKLAFPKLSEVKTACIKGAQLKEKKELLIQLQNILKTRSQNMLSNPPK